ncbi:MAG: HTH domain-containing protein [Betaproteobacteria bacterium]
MTQLLHARSVVSRQTFRQELEVSVATLKRDVEYLRSRMNVPITWDRQAGG